MTPVTAMTPMTHSTMPHSTQNTTEAEMEAQPGWPALLTAFPGGALHDASPAEAQPCAVHGCPDPGRYRFYGQQACSVRCLELLLESAVLAEQSLATASALKARPRVQLGRILIEQGTINEAQLEQALRSQRATGAGRLGCWLKQQVELPEADFTAALSIQWRCPVFRTGTFTPARMASYLPRPLVEEQGALPLRLTGSPERLSLCFEDHMDYELMGAAERMHGIGVDAGLLTATEFWTATRDLLSVPFPRVVTMEAPSAECMIEAMGRFLAAAGASDARVVAVHGCYWLRIWTAAPRAVPGPHGGLTAHDILCTPLHGGGGRDDGGHAVEALAARMLRVLDRSN